MSEKITKADFQLPNEEDIHNFKGLNNRTSTSEENMDVSSNFEVLTNAVKVHTKSSLLNEDTTLANLDVKFSRFGEWVSSNVHTIGIIKSYMKTDKNFVKRSNYLDSWNNNIKTLKKPTLKPFDEIKDLLMGHVHARLIVSRSNKGAPLDAFLKFNYMGDVPLGNAEKPSLMQRLKGQDSQNTMLQQGGGM